MFKGIDNSGENKISNQELLDQIQSRGKLKGEDKKICSRIVTRAFRKFDADNSGYLDHSEFVQVQRWVDAFLYSFVIFRDIDRSGDGSISKKEFRKWQKTYNNTELLGMKNPDEWFSKADKDGGGSLSICEFSDAQRNTLLKMLFGNEWREQSDEESDVSDDYHLWFYTEDQLCDLGDDDQDLDDIDAEEARSKLAFGDEYSNQTDFTKARIECDDRPVDVCHLSLSQADHVDDTNLHPEQVVDIHKYYKLLSEFINKQ